MSLYKITIKIQCRILRALKISLIEFISLRIKASIHRSAKVWKLNFNLKMLAFCDEFVPDVSMEIAQILFSNQRDINVYLFSRCDL